MKIIKIAFVKFGGLSAGGTERWLQMMAANLPKDKFQIDYYYCDAAPYIGSDYKHSDTDSNRLNYLIEHGINVIKFKVGFKDITTSTHDWVNTDFWKKFDSSKYDFVQTARAGAKEYPCHLIDLPIVEFIALSGEIDFSKNIIHSIHLSNWQRNAWLKLGGRSGNSSVIPIPVEPVVFFNDLRKELNIPADAIVAGFHQRPDNNIASEIPLRAFSLLENKNRYFVIMGGGSVYKKWANDLGIKNIHFLGANSNSEKISSFLNTLDIFAHGRKDGETFGTVFAEAMIHGLPCLSHKTGVADAQGETMSDGGFFADDLNEYTEKLKLLFEDSILRKEMGEKGSNYAKNNYLLQSVVKNLEVVYEKVIKDIDNIDKNIWLEIKQKKEEAIKNANRISIKNYLKILFYNKYFFKIYRLLEKIFKKL